MDAIIEFGKIILPAAVVLYAMYLMVKSFLDKEIQKKQLEVRGKSIETVLPNRLHAYERICLFLERMSPNNLIVRLNSGKFSAEELQQILLNEIREEYNHNVSQQVYMSDEAWEMVKSAKEDLIVTINDVASGIPRDASSMDLAKAIFEKYMSKENDPIQNALTKVKDEIRQTY
ncbi:MAG: hypothetical protein R3345_04130 [Fulvivirga sp.]|nr:hypothetical protein [Fulvivirga sp.]